MKTILLSLLSIGLLLVALYSCTFIVDFFRAPAPNRNLSAQQQRARQEAREAFEREFAAQRSGKKNDSEKTEKAKHKRELAAESYRIDPLELIKPYNFQYDNVTEAEVRKELDVYIQQQLRFQAGEDEHNYKKLIATDFASPEQRAMYFYSLYNPRKYYVDVPNPFFMKISLKVDPCRTKLYDLCCDGSNEAVCEDNTVMTSGTDIGVAWFISGFVMRCEDQYRDLGLCGTYIEIHKPNSEVIEEELEVSVTVSSGYHTEFISTKNLCAGRYEFWIVVRNRNGSFIQYVKPFFSIYPSCTSENVVNLLTGGKVEMVSYPDPLKKQAATDAEKLLIALNT